MDVLRITVRVRPGASRTVVGGHYGDEGAVLTVAVNAPPVDGAANEAVVSAIAKAFSVRPRHVTLISGQQSRTKVLDIEVDDLDDASARLGELLDRD